MRAATSSFVTLRAGRLAPTERIAAPRRPGPAAVAGVSSASSGTDALQLLGGERLGVRHGALDEPGEDLARPRLDEALDALGVQREQRLAPADRHRERVGEACAHVVEWLRRDRADN